MYVRIWEYHVAADDRSEFEAAYGPDGAWATLFATDPAHISTELFHSTSQPGRYLTIDAFRSARAWRDFLGGRRDEYAALDERCRHLVSSQREILAAEDLAEP